MKASEPSKLSHSCRNKRKEKKGKKMKKEERPFITRRMAAAALLFPIALQEALYSKIYMKKEEK